MEKFQQLKNVENRYYRVKWKSDSYTFQYYQPMLKKYAYHMMLLCVTRKKLVQKA